MKADEWISIKTPPKEVGEYQCKNDVCEFPAFYIRSLKGEKVWLKVSENLIITHWKERA